MLIRIVKQPIQIVRDGALVYPPVGSQVELTEQEVSDIRRMNPSALGFVIMPEPVKAPEASKPAFKRLSAK